MRFINNRYRIRPHLSTFIQDILTIINPLHTTNCYDNRQESFLQNVIESRDDMFSQYYVNVLHIT